MPSYNAELNSALAQVKIEWDIMDALTTSKNSRRRLKPKKSLLSKTKKSRKRTKSV